MFENKKESFPQREERILSLWEKEKVFQKLIMKGQAEIEK